MALIFPRIANNYAKNGYYPTDSATLERLLPALDLTAPNVAILDPCCGEGLALAEVRHHLSECGARVNAFGVEYNVERAYQAKKLLDVVAHSDIHDMVIKPRNFGLLFLNPPYGDLEADKAQLCSIEGKQGRDRLEKVFFRRAHPWLAFDGVLVLIVPHYVLDNEFATLIAKSYRNVQVFLAPEQQFKQCVILGTKRKSDRLDPDIVERLTKVGLGELPPTLPEHWAGDPYLVPESKEAPHFVASRITARELASELSKLQAHTLWPQFSQFFTGTIQVARPPLRRLSDWHLALALAAGQISGAVRSKHGRLLLVKGDTFKDKTVKVSMEEVGKEGDMREVRVLTDRFVPVIRAWDFTPGPLYGHMVTIA